MKKRHAESYLGGHSVWPQHRSSAPGSEPNYVIKEDRRHKRPFRVTDSHGERATLRNAKEALKFIENIRRFGADFANIVDANGTAVSFEKLVDLASK